MNLRFSRWAVAVFSCCVLLFSRSSQAATYYVWTNSPAIGPGTNWATAFHDIQSAVISASNAGDLVIVMDGVYATSTTVAAGS